MPSLRETDLYPPIKCFLEGQGYEVKGEVGDCDVVAVRDGDEPVLVELKYWQMRVFAYGALAAPGYVGFVLDGLMPVLLPGIFATITCIMNVIATRAELLKGLFFDVVLLDNIARDIQPEVRITNIHTGKAVKNLHASLTQLGGFEEPIPAVAEALRKKVCEFEPVASSVIWGANGQRYTRLIGDPELHCDGQLDRVLFSAACTACTEEERSSSR